MASYVVKTGLLTYMIQLKYDSTSAWGDKNEMVIEGDIVDLSLFDSADALRKAEAFEEIMDNYREEREEAGLGW